MPVVPGPFSPPPPGQSPFSDCVFARYCKPRSYISRTSRGTASPKRDVGICAAAGPRHRVPQRPQHAPKTQSDQGRCLARLAFDAMAFSRSF